MRLRIGYPDMQNEREIIRQQDAHHGEKTPSVLSREELLELQCAVQNVAVDQAIVDYMLALIERTRTHEALALGVSPRGSQAIYRAVQANALVEGRGYALPDDVKVLAPKVLGHRVLPAAKSSLALRRNTRGAAGGERIIEEILAEIEVPL
jgi:MoxR-like ATPase